jgi:catalase
MRNFQRDGHMRMAVPTGRVNYEPNTLGPDGPRECPVRGFATTPRPVAGETLRVRAESFADHYSQARLFYRSQTGTEQGHIVSALVFELSKVETPAIRERIVGHLLNVDPALGERVAAGLGLATLPPPAETEVPANDDLAPSPALSILAKAKPTLTGRVVACLATDGASGPLLQSLRAGVEAEGATFKLIAPRIGGIETTEGDTVAADMQLAGAPSCLFDAVAVAASRSGVEALMADAAARAFLADAHAHLKVIGFSAPAAALLEAVGIGEEERDEGTIALGGKSGVRRFIAAARKHRIWEREPKVRPTP